MGDKPPALVLPVWRSAIGHLHNKACIESLLDELAVLGAANPRHDQVRDALISKHLPVVKHIARTFTAQGTTRTDLEQVATIGLTKAVDRFVPSPGTDFLVFMVHTVIDEIRRYRRHECWPMFARTSADLSRRLGRTPRPSEIARSLGIDPGNVCDGMQAAELFRAPSERDTDGAPRVPSTEQGESPDGVEELAALEPRVRWLPVPERTMLAFRFSDDMTQTQIAEHVGLPQRQVAGTLAHALELLRPPV